MGDFFKEDKKAKKKEEELYDDPEELFAAYDTVKNQIDQTTQQGYEHMLPIREKLFGNQKTVEDIGEIGDLMRYLPRSRIMKMKIGSQMLETIKLAEDLDRWSERYAEYLEEHIKDLELIARSSFKIIEELEKEVAALNDAIEMEKKEPTENQQDFDMATFENDLRKLYDMRKHIKQEAARKNTVKRNLSAMHGPMDGHKGQLFEKLYFKINKQHSKS